MFGEREQQKNYNKQQLNTIRILKNYLINENKRMV